MFLDAKVSSCQTLPPLDGAEEHGKTWGGWFQGSRREEAMEKKLEQVRNEAARNLQESIQKVETAVRNNKNLADGMWAKFNRNVEAIQPSAAILPQLKVEIQRELSKLEFSPRLQAAERKLQALTDRCNNWPDPASIMSQLKVGMKQELANFESGPKLRSMEQSLQTRNDECRELADSLRGLQVNMEESSNKLQEQLQNLRAGVDENQQLVEREFGKFRRNLNSMALPESGLSPEVSSRLDSLEVDLQKLHRTLQGSARPADTCEAAGCGPVEEKPLPEDACKLAPADPRADDFLDALEPAPEVAAVCTGPSEPTMPTARPSAEAVEAASGQGREPLRSTGAQQRAKSRIRLPMQNDVMFTSPAHPTDPTSRTITCQVEKELILSRAQRDTPERKRKFLRELNLRLHPDKGGTDAAMTWFAEWKKKHEAWYMSESFYVDPPRRA
ncbi:unnamed protein product [Symbiodinium pilosum]|uniref:J domain-containing protein n=1 Tax=Symbiodinium pilosum TaxID=2952 RepID=A0A812WK75_SYMPI|nr:unnamed protein product [Symbiodinium pilosum]